jgi:hypothetical protein
MIAINFKEKFADLFASGKKTQTIRRTNRFKVGDTLQLYTGQRTKACRKLGEAIIAGVTGVSIYNDCVVFSNGFFFGSKEGTSIFAQKDGFKDFEEMKAFFVARYGDLPFEGYLIEWKLKGGEG